MLMKVTQRLWIDPPNGWMYGFPKIWNPEVDGNLTAWLVRNGYPPEEAEDIAYVRQWDAKEEDTG